MAYLPSKKFIIVALIILLVGGGMFWFLKGKKTENNPLFPKDKSSLSLNFGQGEKNWEEVLWEIASSSPGINAKMFANTDSSGETGGLTKTDILARDFFANFLALQQSGNLNQENKDKLTESFLASIGQEKLPDQYKLSDAKIINDNSNTALKNYGNEIGRIIKDYNSKRQESDITVINRVVQSQKESSAQELNYLISLYQEVSQNLLKIKTPQSLVQYHLSLVNGVHNFSEAFKNIQQVFQDPTRAIIGIQQYQEEYSRVERALQDISRYFSQEKIFFNQSDNGYYVFVNNRE